MKLSTNSDRGTTYVAANGMGFIIRRTHFDAHDEVEFIRNRLEKELPSFCVDLLKRVINRDRLEAFLAFGINEHVSATSIEAHTTGLIVAVGLMDTRELTEGTVGISLVSVLFKYRNIHIGRLLIDHIEREAALLGARRVESPLFNTAMLSHLGYTVSSSTLYRVRTTAKQLGGPPMDAKRRKGTVKRSRLSSPHEVGRSIKCRDSRMKTELFRTQAGGRTMRNRSVDPSSGDENPSTKDDVNVSCTSKSVQKHCTEWSMGKPSSGTTSTKDSRKLRETVAPNSIPSHPNPWATGHIRFRCARPDDKKQWCALLLSACSYNMGGISMLRLTMEAECRLVAERTRDSCIIGLIAMQGDGWIPFLACDSDHQGEGIGSFLLFLAMEWARIHGVQSVALTPLNRRVISFYQRWGFEALHAVSGAKLLPTQLKGVSVEHTTLVRQLVEDVYLLPRGRYLRHYVVDYEGADDAPSKSPWYYYYYEPGHPAKPRITVPQVCVAE